MSLALTARHETMASIKTPNRIPFQIFETNGQPRRVCQRQHVRENACAEPLSLVAFEQIEFAKASMVGLHHPRECADRHAVMPDDEERLFG